MVARIRANRETQTVKVGGQSCAKQALLGKEAVTIEWKWINGYEGYYQVSDSGLVRSVDRVVHAKDGVDYKLRGHIMKQSIRKGNREDGYFVVNLRKNGKGTVFQVHRLVAEAFIPNPENLPTVNHKDGEKTNNHVSNLEWASYGENNVHALKHGLRRPRGNRVLQYSVDGEFLNEYISGAQAARDLGISYGMISHCLNGRARTAGGFVWTKMLEGQTTIPDGSTPEDELLAEAQKESA